MRLGVLALFLFAIPAFAEDGDDHEERIRSLEDAVDGYNETVDDDEGLGLNLVINKGSVRGIFQIFGDVGFRYDNPEPAGRGDTSFFNGTLDFFFTARVGDHFHVLSETVFFPKLHDDENDHGGFDQERLWGAWDFSDVISVKFGLEHTPLSRWNRQYHHGRWLETSVTRPFLARFEGGGGILPMHNAGLEISGNIPSGAGIWNYIFIIANGRGRVPTDPQEFSDRNSEKSFSLGGGLRPASLSELWIGIVVRMDDIPSDDRPGGRAGEIREYIASFQLDYRGDTIEVLFEFAFIRNDEQVTGDTYDHFSTYVQIAYRINDEWTPYVRFDVRQMDQGDPYFAPFDRDLDIWAIVIGLRWDFINNAALKLEFSFGEEERRNASDVVTEGSYLNIELQLSFVF